MSTPRLQRTPSIDQRERYEEHDNSVFQLEPRVSWQSSDAELLKRKHINQEKARRPKNKYKITHEHTTPLAIIKSNVAKTRRGGKRKLPNR